MRNTAILALLQTFLWCSKKDEMIQNKVWFWVVANKAMNSGFQKVTLDFLTEWLSDR
jgi:hypothetical protein